MKEDFNEDNPGPGEPDFRHAGLEEPAPHPDAGASRYFTGAISWIPDPWPE